MFFSDAFNTIPIAAVVNHKIFCVHGGISPELHSLDQVLEIDRFCETPESGLFSDLLWSDPDLSVEEFGPSVRGAYLFGKKPLLSFLHDNGLELLIRGHQIVQEGFDYPFSPLENIITVISCSNHKCETNKSAFVTIETEHDCSLFVTTLPYEEKNAQKKNGKKKK